MRGAVTLALLFVLTAAVAGAAPAAAELPPLAGRGLDEALRLLRREGLKVVWSSELVRPEMRVQEEPQARSTRAILDEILAPHGLAVRPGPRGRLLVVRAAAVRPSDELGEHPPLKQEIVVSDSSELLRDEQPPALGIDRLETLELPRLGDEVDRAIALLFTRGDVAAGFVVRGAPQQELLVEVDGQELFEPFHLKDFQGTLGIVDPRVVGAVDLVPSGFPVEYGDRRSLLLDITTEQPAERHVDLGISLSDAWLAGSGKLREEKGHWLVSVRRGDLDVVLAAGGAGEETPSPGYWDVFGKLVYKLSDWDAVTLEALAAGDRLTHEEGEAGGRTGVETGYGSAYVWLAHQGALGEAGFVDTALAAGRLDRDRRVFAAGPGTPSGLSDARDLAFGSLRQDWNYVPSPRHYLKSGLEARRYEMSYDYANTLEPAHPIADPRFYRMPARVTFRDELDGDAWAVYAADRLRLGRSWTAEVGLRWDRQSLPSGSQWSPRLNALGDLGRGGMLRLGWGRFHQSQRLHELDVQLGETRFSPAERADHWTLGWEKLLRSTVVRVDGYRRITGNPRPRFETAFEPFQPIPEGSPDLLRLEPEGSTAQGVELFVRRLGGGRLGWWVSYALSSVEEEIGGETIRRSFDQTHAVTAGASYRPGPGWRLNAVWTWHTGWPTTALAARAVIGADGTLRIDHRIGELYALRLPSYHRLDLRAIRTWPAGKGDLSVFFDVQNLYDRDNLRGYDLTGERLVPRADGSFDVVFPEERWLGLMPSLGVSWGF